ncbi:MAG: NusA N-terminal domain-containing protein, partial [Chloroflexota bacterium]
MKSDFLIALTQLAAERSLPKEMVLSAIEAALASAYKKDNVAAGQNIAVRLNPATGDIRVFVLMKVVESVEDDRKEMTLAEARKQKRDAAIDDIIETESNLHMAGRIAAQTAKQVVMQRLREAERELVFAEYASRADDVVTGTIHRTEGRDTIVDLG